MTEQLTRSRVVLEGIFDRIIVNGRDLRDSTTANNTHEIISALTVWDKGVNTLLTGAFTESGPIQNYPSSLDTGYLGGGSTLREDLRRIHHDFDIRLQTLQSIRDMLGLYEDPSDVILVGHDHPASPSSTAVFIVHGRAEATKQQVARFLETATNTKPIILHEQAKRSQVIIETLEEYAATYGSRTS